MPQPKAVATKTKKPAETESRIATVQPGRLSGTDAALYIGIKPQTLANWRNLGRSPKYMRQGRLHGRVYYRIADLDAWIDEEHEVFD
jgi:hypothetical protein